MIMKLEELLNQLPKHSLENDMWAKIDLQLNKSYSLSDKLPKHSANSDLWYNIEERLPKKVSRTKLFIQHISIAASIAVIVSIGAVQIKQNLYPSEVYLTEEVHLRKSAIKTPKMEKVDILENCDNNPVVCSSPNFTRLKSDLDQLKTEEIKLRKLKETVNDPKMDLYHTRIVKNIQDIEAKMLQMFI